jgi:hypothetical protein
MEKKDIIRELVYLKADLLLPAKAAVVMKPVPILEMKYDIPQTPHGILADACKPEKVSDYSHDHR